MARRFSFHRTAMPVPAPPDPEAALARATEPAKGAPPAAPQAKSDTPTLLAAAAAATAAPPVAPAAPATPLLTDKLLDAKVRLHRRLIEETNLSALEKLPEDEMRKHVLALVTQYIMTERLALNAQELSDFVGEILDKMIGLGPLENARASGAHSDLSPLGRGDEPIIPSHCNPL
jgi:pilus assembly protein CpaF